MSAGGPGGNLHGPLHHARRGAADECKATATWLHSQWSLVGLVAVAIMSHVQPGPIPRPPCVGWTPHPDAHTNPPYHH